MIARSTSTLLRLHLQTCQFSQCLFSHPRLRIEGYKLEATPLMIQKGSYYVRLSSSRRASFAIYGLPLSFVLFLSLSLSSRSLSIHGLCYFDSCHFDCLVRLVERQTLENSHVYVSEKLCSLKSLRLSNYIFLSCR